MIISGLQKMTLLDYPGKIACTVFLQGCNFRCPFCHNSDLLGKSILPPITRETLIAFLEKRKGLLDGVCVTGGEPTLSPQLPDLLKQIKQMGFAVKLDTNGYRPDVLKELVEAGIVDYVAMDIKNSPSKYPQTAGISQLQLETIQQSIGYLLSGAVEFEFRTTVVKEFHEESDFVEIGEWLREISPLSSAKRYFLQAFVDRESVLSAGLHSPNKAQMERFAAVLGSYVDQVSIRGLD